MLDLKINIAGIDFPNPVFVSSGTFGYGDEFANVMEINRLGAIITKTITMNPRKGNLPPRVVPSSNGIINSVGLENMGINKFITEKLPELEKIIKIPVIVSIMGESNGEFAQLAGMLDEQPLIKAIELNLSCPNVKAGGIQFGIDPEMTLEVIMAVKNMTGKPIIAKLTPNVTDIVPIAQAAQNAGADALSAVNTFIGMAIDPETWKSKLGNITGGLSGPAIKPLAVYQVYKITHAVQIPVIGIGGILNPEDAIEFFLAGAKAVCIGTGNFVDPKTAIRVLEGIENYLQKRNMESLQGLIGKFKGN